MLTAVITALLFCVMVLVIASLIINVLREVLRERRRHLRSLAVQGQKAAHPLDSHVTMILHMHEGVVVRVEKPEPLPAFTLSSSWYSRHRTLVSTSFLV